MPAVQSRLRRAASVLALAAGLALVPVAASAQSGQTAPSAQGAPDLGVAAPMSLNQCASGRMCLWSGGVYTGSFWGTSGSGSVPSYLYAVGSYWNNRSTVAYLYSGRLGTCVEPGERVSTVSGWLRETDRVSLSSARSC